MREIPVTLAAWNADGLDKELRAALGTKYDSLNTYGPGRAITVRLADGTGQADDDQVAAICGAHVPTPLPDPLEDAADAAHSEVQGDSAVAQLLAATPGQIRAWYDGLTSTQKSAVGRVAVLMLTDHERRLRLLERG
jgi:hypothetical protein